MELYLRIAQNTWHETFAYRISFIIWRVRFVLQVLTLYVLWIAVIPKDGNLFGYSQSLMLTYIIGTSLIGTLVMSSKTVNIGSEINEGQLSSHLLKPVHYLVYYFVKDIGDKGINVVFAIGELLLLFIFLRPPLFFQTDLVIISLSIIATLLALLLYFFFSALMGLFGFWSNETWGPRFIFFQLLMFFSGGLFPLDILPKTFFELIAFLPFPYLMYFPLKIYLGQLAFPEVIKGIAIALVWIFVMYKITLFSWQKGLRVYTAQGS